MIFFCLLFLLNLGSTLSHASLSLTPFNGRIYSDVYVPTDNQYPNKPLLQGSASFWLETNPSFSEALTSKFIYEGDGFDGTYSSSSGSSSVTHWESKLREGYINYSKPGYEVRVGEQIISWGKSDGINPTDYHTAKNFNFFNPDDEVRRIGALSFLGSFTPNEGTSPVTFTGVVTPVMATSKLLYPPSLIPTGDTLNDPHAPPVEFGNMEESLKMAYAGQGWDFSLSGFSGYSHLPELQLASYTIVGSTPVVTLNQVFRNVWAVGADGSFSTEKWIFRGESAFFQTPNNDGSNPVMQPSHWDSVLGAERSLGGDFRVQGQLLMRYFPRYTPPNQATGLDPLTTQVNQLIAQSNALLLQYQNSSRPGATARVSYTSDKNGWDAEVFFLYNFNGGDSLLRPHVSYAWTDLLKSTVGMEIYGGPANSPLGALLPYSSVFAETKYTF
jgi:hypothetical protein